MANFACQWDPSNRVNEKMPEAGEIALLFFLKELLKPFSTLLLFFFFLSFVFSFRFFSFFLRKEVWLVMVNG